MQVIGGEIRSLNHSSHGHGNLRVERGLANWWGCFSKVKFGWSPNSVIVVFRNIKGR